MRLPQGASNTAKSLRVPTGCAAGRI